MISNFGRNFTAANVLPYVVNAKSEGSGEAVCRLRSLVWPFADRRINRYQQLVYRAA